ncbi:uncharacterized protein LOC105209561 [Zeugodacus cucurbitae]|uniref:uncharacterized protein LOC105209561 n=1 Tax=Zeugodacus cucurbitae TaxID=28588 RepID=UPI0023D8E780|nr:uncharacterized protein LOC105209561 [Zeugodacus cucurbitae]
MQSISFPLRHIKPNYTRNFFVEALRPTSKAVKEKLQTVRSKSFLIYLFNMLLRALIVTLLPLSAYAMDSDNIFSPSERSGRDSFFSFRPLGKDVAMGLDFELPFIKVPVKRYKDKFGNTPAMVNINTASLITSGLLAGGSMIVAHLLRSLSFFKGRAIEDEETAHAEDSSEEAEKKIFNERDTESRKKRYTDSENYLYEAKNLFDHFRLVYKNDTGERIETTLPSLFARIEETFLDNKIDIGACVQKTICLMLQESRQKVRHGQASSVQKIIDGLTSFTWLLDMFAPYGDLRRAIKAGKTNADTSCVNAYPTCYWANPASELTELLSNHVKFA